MTLTEAQRIAKIVKQAEKNGSYIWNDGMAILAFDDRITELDNYTTRLLEANSIRLKQIEELEAQLKNIMNWYDKDDDCLGDTSELFEKARELLEEKP